MEKMDVPKAVKMGGEDLALAYDAVRVANKSVCRLSPLTHSFWRLLASCCDLYLVDKLSHPVLFFDHLSVSGFWRVSCITIAVSGRRSRKL